MTAKAAGEGSDRGRTGSVRLPLAEGAEWEGGNAGRRGQ